MGFWEILFKNFINRILNCSKPHCQKCKKKKKILIEKLKETPDIVRISKLHSKLEDIENYRKQGTKITSREKLIIEQEQPSKYIFE